MKIFAGLFEGGRRHCGIENPDNFAAALETIKLKEADPHVAVLDDMIGISDDQQMYSGGRLRFYGKNLGHFLELTKDN